jgi:hypothetical protein
MTMMFAELHARTSHYCVMLTEGKHLTGGALRYIGYG